MQLLTILSTFTLAARVDLQATTIPDCHNGLLDLVFVLDSSDSVGSQTFDDVKTFVKSIIDDLDIGINRARVGLITYSSVPQQRFPLNMYFNKTDMKTAVDKVPYDQGSTETYLALNMLRNEGFLGSRNGTQKVAIVITDGMSVNLEKIRASSDATKDLGVTIFAIGVGSQINTTGLRAIASSPENYYVYMMNSFQTQQSVVAQLTDGACHVQPVRSTAPTPTPHCTAKVADVVFLIDSSGSIGQLNFDVVKNFVKEVVNFFDVGLHYTRIGIITFSGIPVLQFPLNRYDNKADILHAINAIKYSMGSTDTGAALEMLRLQGFRDDRPLDPNIAIVITDGLTRNSISTARQAQLLKESNVTIIAVGVGNNTDFNELATIATKDSNGQSLVFEVGNYDALNTLNNKVATVACYLTLTPATFTTTPSTLGPPSNCFDIEDCSNYPQDVCTDYRPYMMNHCNLTCGFCNGPSTQPPDCVDTTECSQYGSYICYEADLLRWTKNNCPKYCGLCGGGRVPTIPPTTHHVQPTPESCENKILNCNEYGGADMCSDPAYTLWAEKNCREYCGFCTRYTYVKGITLSNNVKCPDWQIPKACSLVQDPSSTCCPKPTCPGGYRLTAFIPK